METFIAKVFVSIGFALTGSTALVLASSFWDLVLYQEVKWRENIKCGCVLSLLIIGCVFDVLGLQN